jgi:hypothetical protein
MSTVTSYDDGLGFLPTANKDPKRRSLLAKIRLVAQAVHEGHVAARRYQELTAQGVPHDKAATQVFAELYRAD